MPMDSHICAHFASITSYLYAIDDSYAIGQELSLVLTVIIIIIIIVRFSYSSIL